MEWGYQTTNLAHGTEKSQDPQLGFLLLSGVTKMLMFILQAKPPKGKSEAAA